MTMRALALAAVLAAATVPPAWAPAWAQETWVAVADDGSRYFGYAVGMATREAAEATAIAGCGSGCSVKLTGVARCVAYARSDTGDASGYAAGASLDAVRQTAWSDCNRRVPANSCTVRAAQCFE
jgi:hypothetical protein